MANKSILMSFPLVGFIIVNLLSAHSHAQSIEIDILMDFKKSLDDPDNVLANWNADIEDPNPCEWFHVTCNDKDRVIKLDLGDTSLAGAISVRLGELNSLTYLDLDNNAFNGTLPDSLGNCRLLEEIDVSLNGLTGPIPSSFNQLSNLRMFNVSYNRLTGPIPTGDVFQQFGNDSFKGNPGLCGPVVGRICETALRTTKELQ